MDTIKAIKTRRSIRRFKKDNIPKEKIKIILECASLAPSVFNEQPWEFVVVSGNTKEIIIENTVDTPKILENSLNLDERIKKSMYSFFENFGNAPTLIIVLMRKTNKKIIKKQYIESVSAAIQNILIASNAIGLGSCWVSIPDVIETKLRKTLDITDKEIIAIIPVGYPERIPNTPYKKNLNDITHWIN